MAISPRPKPSNKMPTKDRCVVCGSRQPRGLDRLVDHGGTWVASVHSWHRVTTILDAGFSLRLRGQDEPKAPGTWEMVQSGWEGTTLDSESL